MECRKSSFKEKFMGFSRIAAGSLGLFSSYDRELREPLLLPQGSKKKREREKFMAINVYMKKKERSQRNNLNLHLKLLVKEEQTKPRISRKRK